MIKLSPRLLDVARLISLGLENKEIAITLGLKEGTIKNKTKEIYTRLNLDGRVRVCRWYIENYEQNEKGPK
jgi:DNA-binding NarL/FixJ family response regulator